MTTLAQIATDRQRIHTPKRVALQHLATRPMPIPRAPLDALLAPRVWRR